VAEVEVASVDIEEMREALKSLGKTEVLTLAGWRPIAGWSPYQNPQWRGTLHVVDGDWVVKDFPATESTGVWGVR